MSIISFLMDCKIWLSRANSYIAIINMGLLFILVISKLNDFGIQISLKLWWIPIFFLALVVLIVVGYVDWRFGLMRYETSRIQQQNPELTQIRWDVVVIKQMLEEMKK